jgi:XTP/dITP diphosphohydrolase
MRELVIATTSKGKFVEIENAFKDLPFKLLGLKDIFPDGVEIEEPGETFEGNAIIKAMTIGKRTGKSTLADDSGLEVAALNGEPGVLSARYAPGSDIDRYQKLLEVMKDIPDGARGAQFRCVIALYDPERGDKIRLCTGEMRGRITREPQGAGGFGYDPVFFSEEAGKIHAQETLDERSQHSHRGKALAKAKEILLAEFA